MANAIAAKSVKDIMEEAMAEYAVESMRAIPDLRDGLKTVQRCILWSAEEAGLKPDRPHMKVAEHAGITMAYHPHAQADGAIVELAQEWKRGMPLIDISGNRGNISGAPAAAGRYINSRQSKEGAMLCSELVHRPVPFTTSYSGKDMPRVLPSRFPVALAIGQKGIAEAMATTILPHSPIELIDGARKVIEDESMTPKKLAKVIKGPDFPMGGYLVEPAEAAVQEAESGQARYVSCGKWEVHEGRDPHIEITEPPFDTDVVSLLESMASALEPVKKPLKVAAIESVGAEDRCDIRISMARGSTAEDMEKVVSYLRSKSKLEMKLSCTNRMLWKGHPLVHGTLDFLKRWAEFRLETLRGVWSSELEALKSDLSRVDAKLMLIDKRDEVVKLAMQANKSSEELAEKLSSKLGFEKEQAAYIAGMALWRLSKPIGDELEKLNEKKASLESAIAEREERLADEQAAKAAMVDDLMEARAELVELGYGKRKSEIIKAAEEIEEVKADAADLIEKKRAVAVVTSSQAMHKIGVKAFANQQQASAAPLFSKPCWTTDFVVAITAGGLAVMKLVDGLPQATLDGGKSLEALSRSMSGLESSDMFVGGAIASSEKKAADDVLVMLTKHGRLKAISLPSIVPDMRSHSWKKKALPAFGLPDGDSVILVKQMARSEMADAKIEVKLAVRGKEKAVSFSLSKAESRSDTLSKSRGMQAVNTKKGEWEVISAEVAGLSDAMESNGEIGEDDE